MSSIHRGLPKAPQRAMALGDTPEKDPPTHPGPSPNHTHKQRKKGTPKSDENHRKKARKAKKVPPSLCVQSALAENTATPRQASFEAVAMTSQAG